ncbi:hypothetical protein D9615_007815 [Tricholomella constricta]|uniref:Uncharacterized protein n=1 Tax=Tricholomella constricta TaxID=117010 RepID=A0A8H5H4K5_9AGAR|nr:hypothetical protein D9615_007815 [Tricholomella constricta]
MSSPEAAPAPPLERALPYVVSGVSAAFSFFSALTRFASFAFSLVSRSISFFSPLPIILYLFAPVIVLFDIMTDVFVRWPRHIALYLLDAFYPLYVFCGVVCIVGAILGLTGRLVARFLVDMMVGLQEPKVVIEVKTEKRRKSTKRRRKEKD